MRRLLLPFLLLAGLSGSLAQAAPYYYFEHYTTHEGLPSNTIHCTFQDSFGFVWIGTRDGLTRFDGYDFRSPGSQALNDITTLSSMDIAEDEDGLIWFSTSEGVGRYDPYTGTTERIGGLGAGASFDLLPDKKGGIWLTGDKIYRYDKATEEVKSYPTGNSFPRKLAIDSYDAVWAIMADGSLYSYNKRRDNFEDTHFAWKLTDIESASD